MKNNPIPAVLQNTTSDYVTTIECDVVALCAMVYVHFIAEGCAQRYVFRVAPRDYGSDYSVALRTLTEFVRYSDPSYWSWDGHRETFVDAPRWVKDEEGADAPPRWMPEHGSLTGRGSRFAKQYQTAKRIAFKDGREALVEAFRTASPEVVLRCMYRDEAAKVASMFDTIRDDFNNQHDAQRKAHFAEHECDWLERKVRLLRDHVQRRDALAKAMKRLGMEPEPKREEVIEVITPVEVTT